MVKKAMDEPKRPTVLSTSEEMLAVKLDDDELRDRGRELAQRIESRNEEAAEQKRSKETMKKRLEDIEGQITDLSHRVKNGEEPRFIKVDHVLDADMVLSVRTDTGEVLRSRVATDSERQINLFLQGSVEPVVATQQ